MKKRGKGIRIVAGFMAFTLFLTSCLFVAFGSDVFGAVNKDQAQTPNPYVDEGTESTLKVAVRGTSAESGADIVVTDEGKNIKNSKPSYSYKEWDPNKVVDSDTLLPIVPGTEGNKGTKDNPFVVLEVVPDKAMQELTYYAGDQESGLPFDPAYFSAKIMLDYYNSNGSGWRFTNDNFKVGSSNGDYNNFITSLNNKINEKYSNWVSLHQYDVFNYNNNSEKTGYMKIFDCSKDESSSNNGSYNFNELYNLDITTDDLLDNDNAVPTKSTGDDAYSYSETSNGKASTKYYTDDLIYLAKANTGDTMPTKSDVESFIKNTLANVKLNYNTLQPSNNINDSTAVKTVRNTDVKKYNLKMFVQGGNQDITAQDMSDSGEFDYYDISQGYIGRGAQYTTKHNGLNISNYWKIRFRKYYVDHFEALFTEFQEIDNQIHSDSNNYNNSNLIQRRANVLKKLLREYEPLFKRKGVSSSITLQDVNDWEATSSDTVSAEKTFSAEAKGGYILAVKPGKGDMYILKQAEVKALMSKMSAAEIKRSGITESSILFTRQSTRYDSGNARSSGDLRWVYVPARWALEGDSRASLDNNYRSGYLDDSNYTYGFASKSIIDGSNYWYSIYDRYNRKFHGSSGNRNYAKWRDKVRFGYDEVSYKMLEKANELSEKANYDKRHSTESDHYFTFDGQTFYDTRTDQMYYTWQRNGDIKDQAIYATDNFHLNILNEMKSDLNLSADDISYIKTNNNLINGPNSGASSWKAWFTEGDTNIQKNFLFNRSGNKKITGLTFNFNTEDTYSYKQLQSSSLSTNRKDLELYRYLPGNGNPDWGVYENSDEITTVSTSQHVAETAKKYSFTYYGFKANPVLQRALFTYESEKEFKNFHLKVICVTPAELNQISAAAKSQNAGIKGKSDAVKLDLVERADMFYIHTHKCKSFSSLDNMSAAYKLYRDMVLQDDSPVPTINDLKSFYDNDLEWDQVMKIWKRCSFVHGSSLPILFNQLVSLMAEESVDDTANYGSNQEDTHMYLYSGQDRDKYSGNMCNIAKLFQVLIQFDFRVTKGSNIQKIGDEVTEVLETKRVRRAFMDDIYPGIGQIKIADSYRSGTKVDNTAQYTGYIKGSKDENKTGYYLRQLCDSHGKNDQFVHNTLYLWNMYTFYPYKLGKELPDTRLDFLEQGYLENYYYSDNETAEGSYNTYHYRIMGGGVAMDNQIQAVKRRVGSNGLDYQNVYVLHANPYDQYDNTNGAAMMSSLSNGDIKGSSGVDVFFNRAFLIMAPGADSPEVETEQYEKNKVYTILSTNTEEDVDLIMYDFFKKSTLADLYSEDELKKALNIYVSINNKTMDQLSVFDVYLRNSGTGEIRRKTGGTPSLLNLDLKEFGDDDKKLEWDWMEESHCSELDSLLESDYTSVMKADKIAPRDGIKLYDKAAKTADGLMMVSAGETKKKYFYVNYTLDDFYNEYDEAVIWYYYWYRDDRGKQLYPVIKKHVINIAERDMFDLE